MMNFVDKYSNFRWPHRVYIPVQNSLFMDLVLIRVSNKENVFVSFTRAFSEYWENFYNDETRDLIHCSSAAVSALA